jgi:hypothetical protein
VPTALFRHPIQPSLFLADLWLGSFFPVSRVDVLFLRTHTIATTPVLPNGASFCEGVDIEGFIVRLVGLPADEDDAYPLECQGADSAVMRFFFLALTPVKLISPGRKSRALLSKLMKSLADEYGAGKV